MSGLHLAYAPEPLRVRATSTPRAAHLPERVVVASFRFRPNPDDIHGGQDAFVHGLVRMLRARGVGVDVITFRGRDDAREAIVEGARVHLLDTPFSRELSAHEAHQRGTWKLLEAMAAYSDAVERFLPELRARLGGAPLMILSHDVAEARWVRRARIAGDRVVTFAHVLFSEFAVDDLDLAEFERMHESANFPLVVRAVGRALLARRGAKQHLERAARLIQRAELFSLLPGPARAALEGERAAFLDAHRVLFPSVLMRDKALSKYRRRDARQAMRVAPWGIDLSPVSRTDVYALAHALGIRSEDRVLVTMSRISPDKRIDALISALKRIDDAEPSLAKRIVAVICGRPTFLDDHDYLRMLKAEAASLRHVRAIFAGYHRGPPRTAYLDLAAIGDGRFVQVGRYEAFGLGIAEALSRGIPVITSDTDGARAIFDPLCCPDARDACALVGEDRGEPFEAALAKTIARELSDRGPSRSADVAKHVAARFTWDATLGAIAGALAGLMPAAVETNGAPELRTRARPRLRSDMT